MNLNVLLELASSSFGGVICKPASYIEYVGKIHSSLRMEKEMKDFMESGTVERKGNSRSRATVTILRVSHIAKQ